MTNDELIRLERPERMIWVSAYLRALNEVAPKDAEAIADDAIRIYLARWIATVPEGEDPIHFANFAAAAKRASAACRQS